MKNSGIFQRAVQLNKRGVTLVTVIVAAAFITFLATTLIYVSGMNYQTKMVDYKVKQSFYEGEVPMEQIKAQLEKDVSDACAYAYQYVMLQYAAMTPQTREAVYADVFFQRIQELWRDRLPADGNRWEKMLQSCVAAQYQGGLSLNSSNENEICKEVKDSNDRVIGMRINGINISVTDADGYVAMISSDFYISAPTLNWAADTPSGTDPNGSQVVNIANCVSYLNWVKK